MITLIIFLVLTAIEYLIYRIKKSELEDMHAVGKFATKVIGVGKEYRSITTRIAIWIVHLSGYVKYPLICLILIVNLTLAYMLAFVWTIISLAFQLF